MRGKKENQNRLELIFAGAWRSLEYWELSNKKHTLFFPTVDFLAFQEREKKNLCG